MLLKTALAFAHRRSGRLHLSKPDSAFVQSGQSEAVMGAAQARTDTGPLHNRAAAAAAVCCDACVSCSQ